MSGVLDLTGLTKICAIRLRLDVKIKKDSGNVIHDHIANPTGTLVTFEQDFIDVRSIITTAAVGNATYPPVGEARVAIYDFVDVPNPTDFRVLMFRLSDGAPVSGPVSWQAEGF